MDLGSTVAADPSSPLAMRVGVVTQVSPLLVRVGAATTATPATALDSYVPAVNDVVTMLEQGADRIVLGVADAGVPWAAATLASPWINYGGGWAAAAYRRVGDQVELRGLISGGTEGTTIAVLPAGFRPTGFRMFSTIVSTGTWGQLARLDVLSTGEVRAYWGSGGASYLSIECSFSTA
jgi:hypothetical protein